jgi:hypothetical protein
MLSRPFTCLHRFHLKYVVTLSFSNPFIGSPKIRMFFLNFTLLRNVSRLVNARGILYNEVADKV